MSHGHGAISIFAFDCHFGAACRPFFASAMARTPKRSLEEAQATIRGLQAQVEERSLTVRRFELQWISESEKIREEKEDLKARREKLAADEKAQGAQRDGGSCVFLGSLPACLIASSWPTHQCFVARSLAYSVQVSLKSSRPTP